MNSFHNLYSLCESETLFQKYKEVKTIYPSSQLSQPIVTCRASYRRPHMTAQLETLNRCRLTTMAFVIDSRRRD